MSAQVELFGGPCDGEKAHVDLDPDGGSVVLRRLDDTSTAIYRPDEDGRFQFVIVTSGWDS
jgi:hypothetical protein